MKAYRRVLVTVATWVVTLGGLGVVLSGGGGAQAADVPPPPVMPVCSVPESVDAWYTLAAAKGSDPILGPASAGGYIGADTVRGFRLDSAFQSTLHTTHHIVPGVFGDTPTYGYRTVTTGQAAPALIPIQGDASRLVTFTVAGRSPAPWPTCLPMGQAPECGDPVSPAQAELLERFPASDGTFTGRMWTRLTPVELGPFRFVRQGTCDGGTIPWRGGTRAAGTGACTYKLIWQTTPGNLGGILFSNVQIAVQVPWFQDDTPTAPYVDGEVVASGTGEVVIPMAFDLHPAPATPPSVGITWSATGTPGTFAFSGNAAAAAPATIVRYTWDFGDGDVRTDAGALPTKAWTGEAATRTVTLTVMDSNGATATTTATLRPALTITEAPTDPSTVAAGDTAALKVVVANDGPSTIGGVAVDVAIGPDTVVTRPAGITPVTATLAPGATQVFTVPFHATKDGAVAGTIDASGSAAGAAVHATQREFTFTVGNPGLLIDLSGQVVEVGRSFAVRMTVTNPGIETVEDIRWSDPTGLLLESADDPPAAEPSVSYVRGPDGPLPTTLASKQTVNLVYVFNAPFVGASVLSAAATGTTAGTRADVAGKQAVSVRVAAPWSEAARDLLVVQGLEDALGAEADARSLLDAQTGRQITTALGWPDATAAQVTSAGQAGLTSPGFDGVLGNALASGAAQADALVLGWVDGLATGMDTFGRTNGAKLATMVAAIEDPVQRHLIATQALEAVKALPGATLENGTYLAKALLAPATAEGLQTIVDENAKVVTSVKTAVSEAGAGLQPLLTEYARQYRTDPVGAMKNLGTFYGGVHWAGAEAGMLAALGEVGQQAVLAAAKPVLKGTVGLFRPGGAVVSDVGTAVAGATTDEAMMLRLEQAERVVDNYQALPAGSLLDTATVTGKGGLLAEDARALQGVIARANAKFGMEFEVAVRTSEPLSAGIDGIAKPEFVKPKAVSTLDQLMGADPTRAGKVGLFAPVELSAKEVATLDAANPGFALKYQERLATQKKLWAEWSDPTKKSDLRFLTEAGEAYRDKGGITVLNARPGNSVPYGMKYLEQLDEPAFLTAKGIDPADVPGIKQQIRAANIDTFKAAPVATVGPNGTVSIDDALTGKPFVSDMDIQSVAPKNGTYAKGVGRGQVDAWFKAELATLKRFPFHGWSDAALDLPSNYYMAAVPFQLGNANPAVALAAANRVASRLALLEKLAREKAAGLLAAGDVEGFHKLVDPFDKLARLKDPTTGLYSSTRLLKEFPPGEKTINFTAGDIRVGYGTGGQ